MQWRYHVRVADRDAVRRLVAETGFFSAPEQDIAVELVDDTLAQGRASGYEFVFADAPGGALQGYACFGPINPPLPGFDLYWIAVSPAYQGNGLGTRLLREAERLAQAQGATEMYIDTAGRAQYRPTRAFYERAGYRIHEVVPDFYSTGDDKVVYGKQLVV
ncbi:MAG: GNAT family N-acetyltransferase [Woeseiaceae bacterium]